MCGLVGGVLGCHAADTEGRHTIGTEGRHIIDYRMADFHTEWHDGLSEHGIECKEPASRIYGSVAVICLGAWGRLSL